jgi:starch synthase
MRICYVASEVVPYAKTGGLADVSGALPRYIADAGNDVRVFMPAYRTIEWWKHDIAHLDGMRDLSVDLGGETIAFSVASGTLPGSNCPVYFIDAPRFFHRDTIYSDSADEYLRFALLCRATLEVCQRLGWGPEIFHCHDWQTALIPLLLRTQYAWDRLFHGARTALTIHNIGYQGIFPASAIDALGLAPWRQMFYQEDLQRGIINYLKTGILYADVLTTVSRTYAREIQTPEYGSGLHALLRSRAGALVGIVNGVDYDEWSPEKDAHIPAHYSLDDLAGKRADKRALLETLGLPYEPNVPTLGVVSRLTAQKGFDLFPDAIAPVVASNDVRLVVLGSGEPRYERFFERLQQSHPEKVTFYRGFSNELAHLIEAGADIFLMPSHYEPCGLNQIYSLRYGTVPVVRRTGGLADTVQHYDEATGTGNGFVFEHYDAGGLRFAIGESLRLYREPEHWRRIVRNGMSADWSWEHQVKEYLALFESLTRRTVP